MNRAARRLWLALALASLAASPLAAAEKEPPADPADQIKLIQAAQPGMVKVEYTLQYDKGQAPHSGGWVERCPNCGQIHSYSVEEYVGEERPLTTPGFLISPTQVAAPDILMHERFIKSIVVRAGGQSVPAKVQAYGLNQKAVILELASPPAQARPIAFEPAASGPYFGITMTRNQAEWVTRAAPWSPSVFVTDQQRRYVDTPANALIVDSRGVGAGMTMNEGAGVDDAWKGSPLQWPLIKTAELARLLSDTQQRVDRQVLRVTLNFRSPKNGENSGSAYYRSRSDEEAAVRQVFGVTVDARTVLVLAELKPKTTARLERIRVNPAEGEPVNATFAGTLSDYGAFLITLDKPLSLPASGALRELTETALLPLCDQLLPSAELSLQGETRIGYYRHRRISGIDVGWRQHLYPQIPDYPDSASPGPGGPPLLFVYDRDGRMLALPVSRRQKAGGEESYNSNSAILTNVAQLNQAIGEGPSALDPNNIPLSEAEENRVAWLGVELQPLTPELARANKVSELTGDGQSGALVTYVYPDSPAAKAGVEAGYILLRLHVEGQPAPLEVRANDDNPWESGFPWDRLSEAPEAVFERIPSPWPSVESAFIRQLTDLGFGKKFSAEFFHDGTLVRKEMSVTQGPVHWGSAPRYKHDGLGVTVRDMTYEVRRYFQKKPEEPGVVISKIEMGSKSSVAGLKPYEIITHINDQPVATVKDFEKLVADQSELRLSVKRMTTGRIVRIRLNATTQSASRPAATAPAE